MNCNQIFIDQLRCPDFQSKNKHASLKRPPKYSQSFIMNQLIHKPRIIRNQYSVQKYSSSTDVLCQSFEQPQVLNLTISQLRDRKILNKSKKTGLCSKSKSKEKYQQLSSQYHERKRSNTYHINSLAKTALLFVNRQDKRMKTIENSDNLFDLKYLELLRSTQQSGKHNPLNTITTLPNYNYESTLISCVSQPSTSLSNQINLVKEYVSEINQYNVKWQESEKITKNIPKLLLEKYATSDDTSLYLESSRFKIERNFNQIYKSGKFRWLYPGEEAAILEGIESFLNECSKKISLLMMSIQKILKLIITQKRLEYLFNYPICMKQIEAHWKIMATLFKLKQQNHIYKNQVTNKLWKDIQASKTLFLDLNLENNKLALFVKQLQH
ncbi:unnamed protein product (macronuclear) [Paramecium tetraurelia]|uniref:Dynein heavy chain linker domain-containing protein n=1 Tax=Paramecium tetraurelia TaxID=5888 RepID=A0BSB8_PARTE|nr:uncharacterized protein GSPATT00031666001 [Paramecium tetraurelia]CAK61435.1 unnamed protein product [Paramecium tetraurelia]|eukprot:XP_001428833.1 hypothetical protein (macronuclear) [Paramecium tetraurelia strain d4-2]